LKKVSKTVVVVTNMGKRFGWLKINLNCQKVVIIKIAPALGELSKNISAKRLSLLQPSYKIGN
jgi:hypothetical protein